MTRSSLFMETWLTIKSATYEWWFYSLERGTKQREGDIFLFSYDHLSCTQELVKTLSDCYKPCNHAYENCACRGWKKNITTHFLKKKSISNQSFAEFFLKKYSWLRRPGGFTTSPSVHYPFTLLRGIRKLSANSSRVFQPLQFNVLVAARLSMFHWRRFFHMCGGGCPGGFLLDFKCRKAWF